MASSGRKIILFDASGNLTKEALLAYLYGGLPPDAHAEVEQHIAGSEMYQDVIEGLKQIPERAQAEKIINELNGEVAERSGSVAAVPGLGENVGDFFWNYRRVAAVVGVALLLSATVLTVALLKVSDTGTDAAMKEETAPPLAATEQPVQIETGSSASLPKSAADSFHQAIAELDEDVKMRETPAEEKQTPPPTGSGMPGANVSEGDDHSNKQAFTNQSEIIAAQTKTSPDITKNEDLAISGKKAEQESAPKDEEALTQQNTEVAAATQTQRKELSNSSGVAENAYKNIPMESVEQMPVFPGGEAALVQYFRNNLRYPQQSKADSVEGKVYLSFIVGTSGKVKDIVVIQGVNKEINGEAIRLIASMPKWEPGKQGGQPVAVKLYRTIEFAIK